MARVRVVPRRPRWLARRLWLAERRTFRQGLVALGLSTVAGFVAGLTLGHLAARLETFPGLLILIPAAVGMKGTVFGAVGARLGTASAAGSFEPTLRRGSVLRRNVDVAIVTSFGSAVWLAVLTRVASAAFGQPSMPLSSMIVISIVGGAIGAAAVLIATTGLAIASHVRGWDLDAVATPLVTALGDVTTLPGLLVATSLVHPGAPTTLLATMCLVVAAVGTAWPLWRGGTEVRRITLHMGGAIALTPILDVAAGGLLRAREPQLLAAPALLMMVPPFVSQAGALGGIFASRLTSKIQLGLVDVRARLRGPALIDVGLVAGLSIAVFVGIAAIGGVLAAATGLAGGGSAIEVVLFAGAIVTPLAIGVGGALAFATSRMGLDPDDQTVPVLTSVMDLAGIACLLAVATWVGVLARG